MTLYYECAACGRLPRANYDSLNKKMICPKCARIVVLRVKWWPTRHDKR